MEQLKHFLITRLLIVMGCVFVSELLVMLPIRHLILPMAAGIARYETTTGRFSLPDIIPIIGNLFFGAGQGAVFGLIGRSKVIILLVLAFVLILIPLAAGLTLYARIVVSRVDDLQKIRDAERSDYDARRNLMLSDFAHDLRTPITTISGYAGALCDGVVRDPRMQKDYLEAIRRKSGRMTELITLLFDYVRLGSADFTLQKDRCDLNALVAEAAATLYTDIEEAGMTLEADIPETPFYAEADRQQALRIFSNLLTNAIRHNPEGTVIGIAVRRLAGSEIISVADTGVRIDKDIDVLFDPFVKGDDSRSGDKGSGLGLSIVKKIADMHGWKLELQQPFGRWTKAFTLKIPEM